MQTSKLVRAIVAAVAVLAAQTALGADPAAKAPPSLVERLAQTLKGDDKPFALVINVYIRPEAAAEFEAAAARASAASLADEGCLAYDFHRDLEKPGHYVLVERWMGLAPLKKHLAKDHTKQIQAVFAKLSIAPRTAEIFAPVSGQK